MIEIQNQLVRFVAPDHVAYLMGDFTDWDERPIPIQEGKSITLEFPRGAYVEYAFLDAHQRPLADSANPQKPKYPWYDYHRAFTLPHNHFQMPPFSQILRGQVTTHTIHSRVLGQQRTYYVYEPPQHPTGTLYIQDGEAYCQKLQFHRIAEALLEQFHINPIRMVFIEPLDRKLEYWFNRHYEAFLLDEILPAVSHHYGVTKEQGLWGASLGGLISTWMAWRNPLTFSKVGSQSGCFTAHPEGEDEYHDPEWLTAQLYAAEHKPLRCYVQTGQIEWLLAPNRRFAAMLADKGYSHMYKELPGGHNWTTWEQGLAPGLVYLFEKRANEER
jgi:enterochelin esterase-like enzyme